MSHFNLTILKRIERLTKLRKSILKTRSACSNSTNSISIQLYLYTNTTSNSINISPTNSCDLLCSDLNFPSQGADFSISRLIGKSNFPGIINYAIVSQIILKNSGNCRNFPALKAQIVLVKSRKRNDTRCEIILPMYEQVELRVERKQTNANNSGKS